MRISFNFGAKKFRSILAATAAAGAIFAGSATAAPITTNDPALANYTLQYGDFQVVSLQFANTATNSTDYLVQSGPGQIRDYIVIGTGAGGNFENGNPGGAMDLAGSDNPYETPNPGGASYFRTGNATSAPDPGGAGEFGAGDTANSWDISLSTLRTYLNGENAVFYFNLNETGVNDQLSGTDLLFYMKVSLVNSGTGAAQDFYLAGNPFDPAGSHRGADLAALNGGPDETAAYPDVAPGSNYYPADPRWTLVHGNICVNGSTFLHYGSCLAGDPAGSDTVKQNVGQDEAAFAGYNSILNDLILTTGAFDTLRVDWRMADLNNGYEQLFIIPGGRSTVVPEPITLGLFGAGLIGVGALYRRRTKKD